MAHIQDFVRRYVVSSDCTDPVLIARKADAIKGRIDDLRREIGYGLFRQEDVPGQLTNIIEQYGTYPNYFPVNRVVENMVKEEIMRLNLPSLLIQAYNLDLQQ